MKKGYMTLNDGTGVYYAGNAELLNAEAANRRFAFVGARRGVTAATRAWINKMVAILNPNDHILVSGLAIGSDTIAHEAALEIGVPQVAVLPSGVDNVYPRQNKKLAAAIIEDGGVLVSMRPNEASACRNSFLNRNKLIIDLSYLAVIGQFNWPSGTANAANHAKKQGKLIIVQNAEFTGNRHVIENAEYRTVLK